MRLLAALVIGGSLALSTGVAQQPVSDSTVYMAPVEELPALLTLPRLAYPKALKRAGIEGRVVVQFILDTSGRAEPGSVTVVETPDSGFDRSAEKFVLAALFRPARVHGRAVRVAMRLPIDFKINASTDDVGPDSTAAADTVYRAVDVDEQPELLSAPRLVYPSFLHDAGVAGRVMVQFVLDTLGRVEARSLKVISTPDERLDQPVMDHMLRCQFRPARVHGRAVRVLLKMPFDFRLVR